MKNEIVSTKHKKEKSNILGKGDVSKKPKKKRKLFFKKLFRGIAKGFKAVGGFFKKIFKVIFVPRKQIFVPKKRWSVSQLNDKGDYRYEFSSVDNFNSSDTISNEEFNPAIHKTSRDYFQLVYPFQSITGGTLPEVKNFLVKWFQLQKDKEKIEIEHFQQDNKKIKNRYVVTYFNKTDYLYKKYYIDIDFRNQKGRPEQFSSLSKVQLYGAQEDASYNTDYDYTQKQDCKTIKALIGNPLSIKCKEVVDKEGYIIKGLYDVTADFVLGTKVETINKKFYVVSQIRREPAKPHPAPQQTKKVLFKGEFLRDIVKKKLEMSQHMFKWWEYPSVLTYYNFKVRRDLAKDELQIRRFQDSIKQRLRYIERDYQRALKDELIGANTSPILDKKNFQMTVDIMQSKVEQINAYYIKKAIQKQTYDGKVKHDIDFYYASLKKHQNEQKEIKEMFEEDTKAYQQDREYDDNFRNWTSKIGNF